LKKKQYFKDKKMKSIKEILKDIYQNIMIILLLIIILILLAVPLWVAFLISMFFRFIGVKYADISYIDFLKETAVNFGKIRSDK
jgi:hypothetical protein